MNCALQVCAWKMHVDREQRAKVISGLKCLQDESLGQFLFSELKVSKGSDILVSVCGPQVYLNYCVKAIEAMCA